MGAEHNAMDTQRDAIDIQRNATKFIVDAAQTERAGILYHGDADGITACAIIFEALERLGAGSIVAIPLGRGLNPFSPQTRTDLEDAKLSSLIVVDSGSRAGEIPAGAPTLVIDHHPPVGVPQVDVFFSTYSENPAPPASLAAFGVCNEAVGFGDLDWVAAIGVVGDLGPKAPFSIVADAFKKYGRKNITDSVVLLNAAGRHRDYLVGLALDVLLSAHMPSEIAKHEIPGTRELERMRIEVQDEL
ncbi:MAG TPA: hypothetical protein VGK02_01270 [Candidatus Aquicultor sp.]